MSHSKLPDTVQQQIDLLRREVTCFECKYGMSFEQFGEYLHGRSLLLDSDTLADEQRQTLGRAVMLEEDDWLEWKAAQEMLESWLDKGKLQISDAIIV